MNFFTKKFWILVEFWIFFTKKCWVEFWMFYIANEVSGVIVDWCEGGDAKSMVIEKCVCMSDRGFFFFYF